MIDACQQAGIPKPERQELRTRFCETLHTQDAFSPTIDTVDDPIREVLSDKDGLESSEFAEAIGLSTRVRRIRLKKLVEQGLVVRSGTSPQTHKRDISLGRSRRGTA